MVERERNRTSIMEFEGDNPLGVSRPLDEPLGQYMLVVLLPRQMPTEDASSFALACLHHTIMVRFRLIGIIHQRRARMPRASALCTGAYSVHEMNKKRPEGVSILPSG